MSKKCICLISLVFLLSMTVGAFAVDVQWDNSGGDRLWRNATNWDLNRLPTSADKAAIRNAAISGPIIDSSTTAVAAQVVLGDWSSTNDTLDMTGGSLTTTSWFVIGYGPTTNHGTFNLSGGTVNCPSTLYVGNTGTAIGTLNMTGGSITATTFGIAQAAGSTGDVFLDGGTISCGTFSITTSGGRMDITLGTLIVDGDATAAINSYISSGWLTAFSGSGTLSVDYNVRNPGKTTVTANSPEKASYPTPANGTTGISINADLSWIAGMYATSHDVYFGTASPGTFRGNQTAVTFDPGTLALGTTYYWRVDEVNSTNPASPWIGDVWSFTTQTGTATLKKGPYLIYPANNTQMTALWQLDAIETCSIVWGTDTTYSSGSANVPEYGTDHQYKYTITSLTPGTKYYYKITVGAGITTGSFRTAPAADATNVKFFMYGDTRTNPGQHDQVAAGMAATYAADPAYQTITLHAGDWVEGDTEAYWTSQWFTNNTVTTNLYALIRSVPLAGCIGNHEGGASVFKKYWPQPFVNGEYYSFDYGPVHVAVVDQYNGGGYTSGTAQYNWLVNDLSTSTKIWKIIVLHEPGWACNGGHPNNTTVQSVIQPLCLQYGVQIVLAGHVHYYSRAVVPAAPATPSVQHVTNGAGGAPAYTPQSGQPNIVTYSSGLAFCKVEIAGNTLTCTTLRPDAITVLDTFTLTQGALPPPGQATNPSPANGAANVSTTADLSWTAGTNATSHDVYFGTTSPGAFQGNQTAATFDTGTMANSTTYYWRIDEKNATGTTQGVVWSFTTSAPPPPPGQATNPSPANGAANVATNATLSWTAGSGATSRDVYFGTTSPGTFQGNQTATTFNPGTLALSTTYYWRIDEKNASGTTTGVVWSFTTTSTAAAPTFVAAGAVSSGTGAVTPALPAGIAANDILLLFLETANEAISISNQNGGTWTAVTNSPQGTGTAGGTSATMLTVFWSRYNGTQGAPTASDSGNHQLGRIIAIRGAAASGNPWDVTAGGVEAVSDTSGSIPGATTTVANTLVVAAIATALPDKNSTANFSSWTNANLTSVTERTDNTVTAGNGGGLGIATGIKATAGAYGNTAVTLANSAYKGMMSIAVKP